MRLENGFNSLSKGIIASFDRRRQHNFDENNDCAYCGGNKRKIGNLCCYSENPNW